MQEKTQLSRQRAVLEQQLGRMHERIDHLESEREHSLKAAEEEGALAAALLRYVAIAVPGVAPQTLLRLADDASSHCHHCVLACGGAWTGAWPGHTVKAADCLHSSRQHVIMNWHGYEVL